MDTDAEYTEMVVEKHLEEQDGVTYKMYEPKPLSQLRLFLLTFAAFGISLAWSVLNGHTSPALQELGLSTEFTSYAWIGGPLLGAVVKLFVGIVSDRITWKIGRRRIFMVFGIVFLISAYALFGNARTIGELLQEKMAGALVAVGSFWIIYASILLIQAPYRALLADTLSPSQQKTGNAYFSFFNGIGKTTGYLLGGLNLVVVLSFFSSNLTALYFIAGIIIVITITITIISTPERQYKPKHKLPNPCVQFIRAIQTFPRPITLTSIVQFLAFLGWFNIWMLFTTWMAKSIYGGDPNAPLNSPARNAFAEGVRAGNIGLMLLNVVCIPYSLILPKLMQWFGVKPVWLFGIGLLSVCLVLTLFITSKVLAFILIGSLGVSFATTLTIPWAIVNASLAHTNEKGIYTALFEIILSFPGIITGCTTGLAMRIFGFSINQTFALGAIPATLSFIMIFVADTSPIDEKKKPEAKEESQVMLQPIDDEEEDEMTE